MAVQASSNWEYREYQVDSRFIESLTAWWLHFTVYGPG